MQIINWIIIVTVQPLSYLFNADSSITVKIVFMKYIQIAEFYFFIFPHSMSLSTYKWPYINQLLSSLCFLNWMWIKPLNILFISVFLLCYPISYTFCNVLSTVILTNCNCLLICFLSCYLIYFLYQITQIGGVLNGR